MIHLNMMDPTKRLPNTEVVWLIWSKNKLTVFFKPITLFGDHLGEEGRFDVRKKQSFVAHRFERRDPNRFVCRVETGNEADQRGKYQSEYQQPCREHGNARRRCEHRFKDRI